MLDHIRLRKNNAPSMQGGWTRWSLRSLPTQTILRFYDSILKILSAPKSDTNFPSISLLTESIAEKIVWLKVDSKKVFEKKNPKPIWLEAEGKTPVLKYDVH